MGDEDTSRLRKLAYDRETKRLERRAYLSEVNALRTQVTALTHSLFALRGTFVTWQDVAAELRHSCETSRAQNQQLRTSVEHYQRLAAHLHSWLETMTPGSLVPRLSPQPWPEISLSAHEDIRAIGFSWLAQQLSCAAAQHLAPSYFPHLNEDSVKVEWGRKGRKFIYQRVLKGLPEVVASALWTLHHNVPGANVTRFASETHETSQVLHSSSTGNQECQSYIQVEDTTSSGPSIRRIFMVRLIERGGLVLAHRTIAFDEAMPRDAIQLESAQEWHQVIDLGNCRVLHRCVAYTEPRRRFATIAEYMHALYPAQYALAEATGGNVSSAAWDAHLHRVMLTHGIACARQTFERLDAILGEMLRRSCNKREQARLRRLAHDREAKRQARTAYIAESSQLQTTVKNLTHQLYKLRGTLLPWKEIAAELRYTSELSCLTNRQLKAQVTYYRALAYRLDMWMRQMQPSVLTRGLAFNAWRDVYLASDPQMRALGLSWTAQQLLHSAEAHLAPALFPHAHEDSIKVEWGRKGRKFIFQKLITGTKEDAAKTLWSLNRASGNHILPGKSVPDGVVQILEASTDGSQRLSYAREEFMEAHGPSVEHVVHLRVEEKDRILIALRTIAQDANFAPRVCRQSCREWNEMRDLGNGTCLVRSVVIAEPSWEYETITEYMQALHEHEYERAVATNKGIEEGSLAWDQYLHRVMLTLGIASSRHYFAFHDKILQHVQANPELYTY
ncbi:hypothetical protein ACHHYP_04963 [Achlya hypogyna]|uniref:Ig-like domain-containing protein n=1 Tax=Achlya hypogyna TaxID=1202772 RepID=A0A1V9YZL1_ACHHY|nr:hypothetical protein ACHHYP_04963 [Achlya hypogyna]